MSYFFLKTKLTGHFKVKNQEGTEVISKQGVKKLRLQKVTFALLVKALPVVILIEITPEKRHEK